MKIQKYYDPNATLLTYLFSSCFILEPSQIDANNYKTSSM